MSQHPKGILLVGLLQKMREYAETYHDEWYVLSAKHGLLESDGDPTAPYDETLRNFSKAEQREWAKSVRAHMENGRILDPDVTLVVHAGKDYYEELLPPIKGRVGSIDIPTEGLAIGETLSWYDEQY